MSENNGEREQHGEDGANDGSGSNGERPDPALREPRFDFGRVEVAPDVQMVVMKVSSMNGMTMQVVIRPELALLVARLLSDQAKEASKPAGPHLIIPTPRLPKDLT